MLHTLTIPAARRVTPLRAALNQVKSAGIPAHCVAEEAGISPTLLTMIASGERTATPPVRKESARALGTPAELLSPE